MPFSLEHRFVQQAQEKFGRTLPLGYVARICQSNGGQVNVGSDVFNLFPKFDTTDRKRISRTCNDIVRETVSAREWPDFPSGAVAIGDNGTGDKLVFLPDKVDLRYADAVFWWDHETGELDLVADAFEELR
ncbi:MAG: SMI1/KNR4 family protein [Planctomycetes bacterium]|nr:SMI1/KNR4 family protein [Planctomycetota bacterium]